MIDGLISKFKSFGSSNFINFEVTEQTLRKVKQAEYTLQEIVEKSTSTSKPKKDQYIIILTNFYNENYSFFTTPISVRRLSWALDYRNNDFKESIIDKGGLVKALELIDKKFSSSCYAPLIYVLLSNWKDNQAEILRYYLKNKLKNEQNFRPKIIFFKDKLNFFINRNGPEEWADFVYLQDGSQIDEFFEKHSVIAFAKGTRFFKLFTIRLFENAIENGDFEERNSWQGLIEFSKKHFENNITKYLISLEIVEFRDSIEQSGNKDLIKNHALEIIGDPNIESHWVLSKNEFKNEQVQVVSEARKILNYWINESLVDLFFSKVVDDVSRKRFWMNYVSKMKTVDIFLADNLLWDVFQDERVKNGMESRFGILHKGGNTSSVIIFSIQQFRFVLAGSLAGGALYVHPNTSVLYPKIEEFGRSEYYLGKRFRKLDKNILIHATLQNLIEDYNGRYYFNDEGRMVHLGNWQRRLNWWMETKIG